MRLLLSALLVLIVSYSVRADEIRVIEPFLSVSDSEIDVAAATDSTMNEQKTAYEANPTTIKCLGTAEFHSKNLQNPIRFRIRYPKDFDPNDLPQKSERRYPLVLWLHGVGESEDDNARQLAHMQFALPAFAASTGEDVFIIAPQCPRGCSGWDMPLNSYSGETPLSTAGKMLDAALRDYPIDSERIYVAGICSGAIAAVDFAATRPNQIAATVLCSCAVPCVNPGLFQKTSVLLFNNVDDGDGGKTAVEFANSVNAVGGFAWVSKGVGAHDSWTRGFRDEKAFQWMLAQRVGKKGPHPRAFYRERSEREVFYLFKVPILLIAAIALAQAFGKRSQAKKQTN